MFFSFNVRYSTLLHLQPPQITLCRRILGSNPELVFSNFYGAQESIPPAYVAWRTGTTTPIDCLKIPALDSYDLGIDS